MDVTSSYVLILLTFLNCFPLRLLSVFSIDCFLLFPHIRPMLLKVLGYLFTLSHALVVRSVPSVGHWNGVREESH